MIQAIHNYITAEPIDVETKTKSGLFMSVQIAEEMQTKTAKVISTGDKVVGVKVGDEIVYKPYASFDFKYKDKAYLMIEDCDVLGVVGG